MMKRSRIWFVAAAVIPAVGWLCGAVGANPAGPVGPNSTDEESASEAFVAPQLVEIDPVDDVLSGDFSDVEASDIQDALTVLELGGDVDVYDVAPCGGNDTIDVDDILAMLDAFSGNYACNCPGGAGLWVVTGVDDIRNSNAGNVRIGTLGPNAKLHINGDGVDPSLRVQVNGGSKLTVASNGGVSVGVLDDTPPDDGLRVDGQTIIGTATPIATTMLTVAGNATNPRAAHFTGDSFHPLRLDRTTTDGNLIEFNRDGVFVGSVSVNAGTMTYGAFTGSHYGWMDRALQRGTLVVMTGENRHLHGDDKAEPIYGIAPSEVANDARCFGAYLSLLEPQGPADLSNPHQVMAVGNGDMWVVDTGRAVRPGDYLISSDVTGHAMLDDESRFPIGNIIARAGEPVDWSRVTDTVDGRKHQRISVFFESFERGSAVGVAKLVEKQQQEIEDLRSRIGALEKSKPSAAIQAGLPLAFLGVAGFLTLRRRGANEVAGKASSNDRT